MNVPRDVPANVPDADGPAPAPTGVAAEVIAHVTADVTAEAPPRRSRAGKTRKRNARNGNGGTAPHLTRDGDGWRFQIRVPAALIGSRSRVAGASATIRASLGPRGRGEARRLARQLAAICDTAFALAVAKKDAVMTTPQAPDNDDHELARQVIDACQQAIKSAVAQPSRAMGLARAFDGALASLRLVQSEVGKGNAGARAVVERADVLTRGALADVLAHAADPEKRAPSSGHDVGHRAFCHNAGRVAAPACRQRAAEIRPGLA